MVNIQNYKESEFQDLFQNVEEKEEEELSLSGHTPDPQHSSKSFNFRYRTEETNILYKLMSTNVWFSLIPRQNAPPRCVDIRYI